METNDNNMSLLPSARPKSKSSSQQQQRLFLPRSSPRGKPSCTRPWDLVQSGQNYGEERSQEEENPEQEAESARRDEEVQEEEEVQEVQEVLPANTLKHRQDAVVADSNLEVPEHFAKNPSGLCRSCFGDSETGPKGKREHLIVCCTCKLACKKFPNIYMNFESEV